MHRSRSEVSPRGRSKEEMTRASYYRRVLPSPPAIDFASDEGQKLFREALPARTLVGFFMLISHFQTQSEPAYCGLATLAMVLNALAIDPGRTWKGPWRWYDESMLASPKELKKIEDEGISFGDVVHRARRAGAEVEAFQTNQTDVDFFRQSVKKCCSSDNCHLVSSYHRAGLEQAGTGHFSPIGGYHGERDMVLILDVARFKYPPHWVPLTLLWEAMDTVDKTTGRRRGFMLISKPKRDAGLLYTLSYKNESWVGVVKYLMDDVPHLLKSKDVKDINGILSILLASPPSGFGKFIQSVAEVKRQQECGIGISEEEKQRLASREELLKQVRDTGVFEYVVNFLPSTSCCSRVPVFGGSENLDEIAASVCSHGAEPDPNNCTSTRPVGSNILTVLLLMLPPETWCSIKDEKLREEVRSVVSTDKLPAMLQREVLHLRRQLYDLKKCEENMAKRKSAVAQKKSAFAHGLSPPNWINIHQNIRTDLLLLSRNLPLPMASLHQTGLQWQLFPGGCIHRAISVSEHSLKHQDALAPHQFGPVRFNFEPPKPPVKNFRAFGSAFEGSLAKCLHLKCLAKCLHLKC